MPVARVSGRTELGPRNRLGVREEVCLKWYWKRGRPSRYSSKKECYRACPIRKDDRERRNALSDARPRPSHICENEWHSGPRETFANASRTISESRRRRARLRPGESRAERIDHFGRCVHFPRWVASDDGVTVEAVERKVPSPGSAAEHGGKTIIWGNLSWVTVRSAPASKICWPHAG